ncbi:MAG TPA: cell surface glycoprotein [Ruminococcaceae bacterium]|nr:cell surface glycoprotein [Oscillospiraceae bacterium]
MGRGPDGQGRLGGQRFRDGRELAAHGFGRDGRRGGERRQRHRDRRHGQIRCGGR